MNIRHLAITLAASLLLAGCAANNPRHFESVVKEAEADGSTYTDREWEKADAQYEAFIEKYSDMETLKRLSSEERQEVGRLAARYLKVRMQHAASQMGDLLQVGSDMSRGFLDELNLSDPDASGELMQGMDELMKGFDELMNLFGGE